MDTSLYKFIWTLHHRWSSIVPTPSSCIDGEQWNAISMISVNPNQRRSHRQPLHPQPVVVEPASIEESEEDRPASIKESEKY
jgi:hypothetical protein